MPKESSTNHRCWAWYTKKPTCQVACPASVDIPGYVIAVAEGRYQDAYNVLKETLPLPAVCAYICHHPCESECLRKRVDEPIAIKSVKRFVTDYAMKSGKDKPISPKKAKTRREKVAIIGAGPAGLSAGQNLAEKGYDVTIFEALPVAGGMLVAGVPEFCLPREIIKSEVNTVESQGIKIMTNTRIGKDISFDDLRKQHKAVFVAVGRQLSSRLKLENIDSEGVLYALPFLKDVNLGQPTKIKGKVAVIGGGNVAIDVARAALRLGADEVYCACLETRDNMPAFKWEIARAEEEGVKLFCGMAPQKIVTQNGRVSGVEFADVKSIEVDDVGRFTPLICQGTECNMAADTVVIAVGQATDLSFLQQAKGLEYTRRGAPVVDADTLATSLPGVFAGGDVINAAGTAVEAMAAGRKVAESIHRYLRGIDLKEGRGSFLDVVDVPDERLPKFVERRKRQDAPLMGATKRSRSFDMVELGFSEKVAVEEAKRCLNCPMCGNCIFDRYQMCFKTASRLL